MDSDAEMDSSLGILSPSDMKTSEIMSMTASQASNQGTYCNARASEQGRGQGAAPQFFEKLTYFSLNFHPKNIKSRIIHSVPPTQFLLRPLSFRQVVPGLVVNPLHPSLTIAPHLAYFQSQIDRREAKFLAGSTTLLL